MYIADKRYAYIQFVNDQSYSVVQMKTFELREEYNLNEIYNVRWQTSKLKAILLFIGNSLLFILYFCYNYTYIFVY